MRSQPRMAAETDETDRKERRLQLPGGSVVIRERPSTDVGCFTWPAAFALVHALDALVPRARLVRARILELGAGTALAGMYAAVLQREARRLRLKRPNPDDSSQKTHMNLVGSVTLTDSPEFPEILRNLQITIAANALSAQRISSSDPDPFVSVEPLAWGDLKTLAPLVGCNGVCINANEQETCTASNAIHAFDLIIGADVFYNPEDFDSLLATVAFILSHSPPDAVFITAYHERSSRRSIQPLLHKWGLVARQICAGGSATIDWIESCGVCEERSSSSNDASVHYVPVKTDGLLSVHVFEIRAIRHQP